MECSRASLLDGGFGLLAPFFVVVRICRPNFVSLQNSTNQELISGLMCGIGLIIERRGSDEASPSGPPIDFDVMRREIAKRGPDGSHELVVQANDFSLTFIGSGPLPTPFGSQSFSSPLGLQCWRCVAGSSLRSRFKTTPTTCSCGMAKCLAASR